MKNVFTALFVFCGLSVFAQNYERCLTPAVINYQNQMFPGYAESVTESFNQAKAYQSKSNVQYTIPVVVHVIYNSPEQNIADSVILDQIRVLNEDFNRENADTVNMRSDFDIVKGNPNIKFKLATIDENGQPTTGITRTFTTKSTYGSDSIFVGNLSEVEMVKSTADGGQDPWDQERYMNIWVCNMNIDFMGFEFPTLLGYATPPANLPNWPTGAITGIADGIVVQYNVFGSNNPNPIVTGQNTLVAVGRTTTHEVGHYLGLRHIWGDGDCTEQDGIDDTPNAADGSQFDCDPSKNSCVDDIFGVDLPDMIENYMDYSEETCQNSFTAGQVDLMRGVLEGPRFNLISGNPAAVNENKQLEWQVTPNPSTGNILVKSEETIDEIKVIGLDGVSKLNQVVNSKQVSLDIGQLSKGVYFVQVIKSTGISQERVVIK